MNQIDPNNSIDTDDLTPVTDTENMSDEVVFEEDPDARDNAASDLNTKFKKLKDQIESLKTEKQQYLDNWQRDKAEFINARKRDEEAKTEFLKFATTQIIEDILPLLDSFAAAMKHSESVQGLELIHSQLISILKKHGVDEFGVQGEAFDPAKHQAIANVQTEEKALDHTLAEVLQKGYSLHGKIVRPALVKVFQA